MRYRILFVYFEFTHQESHLRNEPVSHCAYFEYPQPHHVRLGFTKQCLRIPLCDTLHRIRCWVRTPILFIVGFLIYYNQKHTRTTITIFNVQTLQLSRKDSTAGSSTRCTSCSAIHCNATTGELRVVLASTSNCFPSEQL